MNVILKENWTVDRFLAWEDKQEGKYEFDGTRIIEMTGGSRGHQRIVFNILRFLIEALDPARFDVIQEMRTTNGSQVRYPDVVVCQGRVGRTVRTLHDALVIFEVLSDDTAETDLEQKRDDYARLPGLDCYVLVEQNKAAVKILRRAANGWLETPVTKGDVALDGIGTAIPLDAIYATIDFN